MDAESVDFDKTVPVTILLDACREIEAKLTDEQFVEYMDLVAGEPPSTEPQGGFGFMLLKNLTHARAEWKVKALAAVLRGK